MFEFARDNGCALSQGSHLQNFGSMDSDVSTAEQKSATGRKGISPGFEDIAVAATGKQHDLIVLTENEKDFRPLGVRYQNPFVGLPE
jgi:hypothetical protein